MNQKLVSRKVFLMAVALLSCSFAMAEETAVVGLPADSSRVVDLDEVVVVSQPKEFFNLRRQALSSSVFSQEQTERLGIGDLRELSQYVPSFTMPSYGSRLTSSIYIRGIGARVNSPAAGLYIDGMPVVGKAAFNFHTYGLERIDVLRGPQGTLYGQNTEGGMVRLYTRNPMQYQGTDVSLGASTYGGRGVEAAHYRKLGTRSALSLAAFYQGQDGFFRNQTLPERADRMNEAGGRLRFITALGRSWQLDYWADYQFTRQNAFPYGVIENGETALPATNRQGSYRRNMLHTALNVSAKLRGADFHSTTSYQFLKDNMLMDQDYLPEDFMHLEQQQFQNALTEELVLKSNNASRWHWTVGLFGSYQWLKTDAPVYFHDRFNELMASNIRTGLINQMIPAFMQARGMTYDEALAFLSGMVQVNELNMSAVPGLFHTPQANLGLFHESNFDITSRLTATLGLRYDLSHVSIDYASSAGMAVDMTVMRQNVRSTISSVLENKAHDTFHQLLPKAGLRWTIDQAGSNVYLTVAKGYRAGGFNIQLFSDVLQTELQNNSAAARSGGDVAVEHTEEDYQNINQSIAYKPEESWNYELGAHLNLLSGRVQFDCSAYLMQIRNQQLSVMAGNYGYGRMMVNAGRSRSMGVEASLRGLTLGERLNWTATYAYTNAVFRDYEDQVKTNGQWASVDYKGRHVPFVPTHSFALTADYTLPLNSFAIVAGANFTGSGRLYWDEQNSDRQGFYSLLGAHVDLVKTPLVGKNSVKESSSSAQRSAFGLQGYTLSLWAKNLLDRHYNTFAVESGATGTSLWFAQRGNPLQLGVDLRLHF